MAEEEDLDLDVEGEGKSKGMSMSPKMMIIIMAVFALIVIAGAVTAVLLMGGSDEGGGDTDTTEQPADGAKPTEEVPEVASDKGDTVYVSIEPPFVVNFEDQTLVRYLQIGVSLMTKDSDGEEKIRQHMPMIKSRLLLMYSAKTYEDVRTLEGKKLLQSESLSIVREALKEQTGMSVVDSVLFTSFVMQ